MPSLDLTVERVDIYAANRIFSNVLRRFSFRLSVFSCSSLAWAQQHEKHRSTTALLLTHTNNCFVEGTDHCWLTPTTVPTADRLTGCSVRLQGLARLRNTLGPLARPQLNLVQAKQRNDFVAPIRLPINGFTPC